MFPNTHSPFWKSSLSIILHSQVYRLRMLKQEGGLPTRRTCKRHFQSAGAALKQQTLQSKARHTWTGLASMYRQSAQACTDERVLSPVTTKPVILDMETKWESPWENLDTNAGVCPAPTFLWWQKPVLLEENYLLLCDSDSFHNRSTRSLNFQLPTPFSPRVVLFNLV